MEVNDRVRTNSQRENESVGTSGSSVLIRSSQQLEMEQVIFAFEKDTVVLLLTSFF